MKLRYFGHSCFHLSWKHFGLLLDPFSESTGYKIPFLPPVDVVAVSHDHSDHNNVAMVSGSCSIIRGAAPRSIGPLKFEGRIAHHYHGDRSELVSLMRFDIADRRIGHFGDV